MPNKYLQAGIGLTAALLTPPFLVQSAQAQGGLSGGVIGLPLPQCNPAVSVCAILFSGINPDGNPSTDVETDINNEYEAPPLSCVTIATECHFDTQPPTEVDIDTDTVTNPPAFVLHPYLDSEGNPIPFIPNVPIPGPVYPTGLLPCQGCSPISVINTSGLAPTAVPEPLTLLGASSAIAFGAGFKRRKKQG